MSLKPEIHVAETKRGGKQLHGDGILEVPEATITVEGQFVGLEAHGRLVDLVAKDTIGNRAIETSSSLGPGREAVKYVIGPNGQIEVITHGIARVRVTVSR